MFMTSGVYKLFEIANKKRRLILGLMSGTSLDGLDLALCEFSGFGFETKVSVLNHATKSYDENFKSRIKEIFSIRNVDLQQVCILNAHIGRIHAQLINEVLAEWKIPIEEVDLIASHGQTIFHAPAAHHRINSMPNATLQIGDGDHIAVGTGIITISDFRQKNIAAGGEGAPLAVYGDRLLFSSPDETRVLLNIGGISNFTFLPSDAASSGSFSTDAGPGNGLMDAFVKANFPGKSFDEDARIALAGKVHEGLLSALLEDAFFKLPFPKTTGPELFNLHYLKKAIAESKAEEISKEDIMATLNRFTAQSITKALKETGALDTKPVVYVSGGGVHNPLLMQNLKVLLSELRIENFDKIGIHPDAKEAVLFALLANECLALNVVPQVDKNVPSVRMGKVSFPD